MKNYKIYSLVFLLTLLTISCKKDFLNRTPEIALDDNGVFADPLRAASYADAAYNYMINDYARFNDHRGSTAQASDEAVSGNSESSVTTLNRGLYHDHSNSASLNDMRDVWTRCYAGIAINNKVLARMAGVPAATVFPKQRIEGEMRFLRAFSYFELIKRFGGVPIMDKEYSVNDDINFPRASYQACVDFIIADLDKAVTLLNNDADNGASNYGRATKGGALALKSRVLLYAASPLNNPNNDKAKWQLAADAASKLMDGTSAGQTYALQSTYADILNMASSPEYIMIKIRGPRAIDGILADYAMSPGSGGAQGQMNPTQNHVDMYEMANGKAITDATSGYNPQQPYLNRDPRFYANILYNDQAWQGKKIEMWSSTSSTGVVTYGKDWNPTNIIYTATRYYCKKYWPETYVRLGGTSGTALINYIFFRYAEIMLNYAEAQNEANGPDASVYKQLTDIRARAGIAAGANNLYGLKANMTQDEMRLAIRHERAIELAFEDHRWYDIMRWKIGPQVIATPMYGMNVVKNSNGSFTYTPVVLGPNFQKTYTAKQDRYPIPRSEIYKSNGVLIQNPGWE
ncbi:RagB/SusD family nutrient uptake outer membrane protein [Pedobacter zeae]|uniref:RagB/SusD family nutrient uptake outer membrane protein n=1 Tax=Pedobacter zeae TaxID=1737356 RepID=A0A7W6P446_9SPHI|nr:RagB/SusD family nutrient uptake outer membrane protein [Pedobacter zeae]MBB4106582.1 hypothetical protein [Pedobacter zeae]GGH02528.1 hypothetical protein GCM10007422_17050 [Pedobacter zeae]